MTRQGFSDRFDRYFPRVYTYVSRRVSDKGACERIVRDVLIAHVDLLAERGDEERQIYSIKVLSDRLIELDDARKASAETVKNTQVGSSGPWKLPGTERGIDDDQRKVR